MKSMGERFTESADRLEKLLASKLWVAVTSETTGGNFSIDVLNCSSKVPSRRRAALCPWTLEFVILTCSILLELVICTWSCLFERLLMYQLPSWGCGRSYPALHSQVLSLARTTLGIADAPQAQGDDSPKHPEP